jgi:FAD binding domain
MGVSQTIFVGDTVSWSCEAAGKIEVGVVDASLPGVADGISRLLVRSIQDARSDAGGHLPGWLVDDIERNYISAERVRTLWAATGHRFAMLAGTEIVGTVHVARRHDVILTADRSRNNVSAADLPGLKPDRQHQVVNVSVLHELRREGLAARMFDAVTTSFRHLFDGDGLWVRADPPWHPWLARLGFVHDPSFDVLLPESVERTSGLPHCVFNVLHACACEGAHASARAQAMTSQKLQYVSFTRAFDRVRPAAVLRPSGEPTPADVDGLVEVVAKASRDGRRVAIRGAGSGPPPRVAADDVLVTRALDRVTVSEDHVSVGAGATWRALLAALPPGRLPPVVPGYVDATIGGSLSTGGIGKGSAEAGLVIDHVRELLVVTRDGRRIVCSAAREAWLFEAMLGGHGEFGVIAEATLPLVSRRARVVVVKTSVPRAALVSALNVTAYHAFATRTDEGWLAIVARESNDGTGVPIATFLAPERPLRGDTCMFQAFFDARGLERFLAEPVEADEITIHPIRQPVSRRALLFPKVEGTTAYAVTITSGVGRVRSTRA